MQTVTMKGRKQERTTEIIPIVTAPHVIERLDGPISKSQKEKIEDLIEAEVDVITYDLEEQYQRQFAEARAQEAVIDQHLHESETRLQNAQEALRVAETTPGSFIRALLYWCGAFFAAVCEYYITNVTLPQALDVERTSLLGIALSLGPVVAFIALEKPLELLQQSSWRKTYIAFLWGVLVPACLITVALLAAARHEVARVVQALLQGQEHIMFDDQALNRAILALSLLLAIAGALFLVWAHQHGGLWLRYRKVLFRVRRAQKQRNVYLLQKSQQTAEVEVCRRRASEHRPALIAENFRKQCVAALEKVRVVEPTSTQRLEEVLGLAMSRATAVLN
jgi:hypothetical protein